MHERKECGTDVCEGEVCSEICVGPPKALTALDLTGVKNLIT